MFERKLRALGYHHHDLFSLDDEQHVRTLVVWLEDQKIRFYPSEDRKSLREITSAQWHNAFTKYLQDLECPVDFRKQASVIDWLLGCALRLEYADNCEVYSRVDQAVSQAQTAANTSSGQSSSKLATMDPDSADFKQGVASLAKLLQLPQHSDPVKVFQAARMLLESRFSPDAMKEFKQASLESKDMFALDKMDLGFDTKNKCLNQAAKVLRLLHIAELRQLQTSINEIIVTVQTITANPKTDERLGKVGR
eukprot:scpid76089/ scgid20843/ UPF0568 protein C14orf166; CLE7 homolog; UPF0568 protein C14orf166 homolog